jgi:hypothetical protein
VTFETGDFLFFVPNNETSTGSNEFSLLDKKLWIPDQTMRVLATVLSCVIMYVYTFYLLAWEWCENIALRRIFFLEANHYSQRMGELNRIKRQSVIALGDVDYLDSNAVMTSLLSQPNDRPEYLTHPEIRESPPSVGIFSVLYQLPRSMVTYDTHGATTLERQLVATTNFFDEIIPPDAGFSSSVAAVTVLPNASLLAKANSKWEICEKKVQRLRVIRRQIRTSKKKQDDYERNERERQKKLSMEQEELLNNSKRPRLPEGPTNEISIETDNTKRSTTRIIGSRIGLDGSIESISSSDESSIGGEEPQPQRDIENPQVIEIISNETPPSPLRSSAAAQDSSPPPVETTTTTASSNNSSSPQNAQNTAVFRYEDFNIMEYASSIGFHEEVHEMIDFVKGMDIEEFSVFASKCAYLAGSDPQFNKMLVALYGIEILKEEEMDLMEELRVANHELLLARENVAMLDTDEELEESEQPVQPSIHFENEDQDDTIQGYGNCESSGLRRRKTIPKESGSVAEALPGNLETNNDTISRECSSPKPSILRKMWGFLECFFRFPRRVYRGLEGDSNNGRESRKYYGTTTAIFDGETGRGKGFVTNLQHPAYAVVTFTTRKAAVIARQCLADGAAHNHWKQVDDIPIYPLADAPPWGFL